MTTCLKVFMGVVLLLTNCFCEAAVAAEQRGYISIRESLVNPDDDNLLNTTYTELAIGYNIGKYLAIEMEGGYIPFTSRKNEFSNGSSFIELPLTLNLIGKLPINNKLSIYGVYGYGRSFFINKKLAINESLKVDNSRCVKYGGGVEWKLNQSFSLNAEASYHYSDTGEGSSLDSWGWVYGGGIKYRF